MQQAENGARQESGCEQWQDGRQTGMRQAIHWQTIPAATIPAMMSISLCSTSNPSLYVIAARARVRGSVCSSQPPRVPWSRSTRRSRSACTHTSNTYVVYPQ